MLAVTPIPARTPSPVRGSAPAPAAAVRPAAAQPATYIHPGRLAATQAVYADTRAFNCAGASTLPSGN